MKSLYLITGDDQHAGYNHAQSIIDRHLGMNKKQNTLALEVYKNFEKDTAVNLLKELVISLHTPSFITQQKIIWVKGHLEKISTTNKNGILEPILEKLSLAIKRIPEHVILIVNAPKISPKNPFYKLCSSSGTILQFHKPKLTSSHWQESVHDIIQKYLGKHNMRLSEDSIHYLTETIGVDTERIEKELEKLFCYAGERPTFADVQTTCSGTRDTVFYALSHAICSRDTSQILQTISQSIDHKKDDNFVIAQVRYLGKFFYELLQIKIIMSYFHTDNSYKLMQKMSSMTMKEQKIFYNNEIIGKSSWRLRSLSNYAKQFTGVEIIEAIHLIMQVDKGIVSGKLSKRIILEILSLQIGSAAK